LSYECLTFVTFLTASCGLAFSFHNIFGFIWFQGLGEYYASTRGLFSAPTLGSESIGFVVASYWPIPSPRFHPPLSKPFIPK